NPRQVPGILASAENPGIEQVPYHSDFQHPSVFWIMNGWNDFEYNMAAGATACGVCYWLVPGSNSGPSLEQQWDSYASLQTKFGNAGTTPLKKFEGNYCTSAMNSFNTVGNSAQCHGVGGVTGDVVLDLVPNPLVPRHQTPPTEAAIAAKYYPKVADAGSRIATNCYYNSENDKAAGAFLDDKGDLICSEVARCSGDNADTNCKVTVLDRYTTAFHWAQHNFSAVWLRPLWSLVQNSVISDVQNAGLTFVTGGDYTKASSPEGNWLLARKNVFIGHTQDDNPYASDAGPFNPQGLACDSRSETTYYCISKKEGISVPIDNWAVNQRLFNIYDGPAQQESNAFLNITKTYLEKDKCTRGQGSCKGSRYIYGRVHGVLYDGGPRENEEEGRCYLPNAAIAWKQPNGFYYPPSFHSRNLYFEDVEIRHFVVEPLFEPGTRISNR
ncbi:MAG: hypothetical protein KDJ99_33565, partial [Candidatus Competibacteraceae bacterium]|nr:hypothetical protein [Candidatus Competibacteraceae bacterium]